MEGEGNYFHTFYFQAFSDEFALVSEEVDSLDEEGDSSVSKLGSEGQLSAKLQDVRSRFQRIQQLVEKQKESNEYERFENAVQAYRKKYDAVSATFHYKGRCSEEKDQFSYLEESFQALEELGKEINPSVSEKEKTKINSLLNELKISLETLKLRNNEVLVGATSDNEGSSDTPCPFQTGDSHVITTSQRLNDDSDVDSEEHRMLKGSSDGSQYGSDSGMGDSLMNTLASECTDGLSKTLTVSSVNNIGQKHPVVDEGNNSGETSPTQDGKSLNDKKSLKKIDQTMPECVNECKQGIHTQASKVLDCVGQDDDKIILQDNFTATLEGVPVNFITHKARFGLDTEDDSTVMNDITEGGVALNNVTQTPSVHKDGNVTVVERPDKHDEIRKTDEESEADSMEYLRFPQTTQDNVLTKSKENTPVDLQTDHLKPQTISDENSEQSTYQRLLQPQNVLVDDFQTDSLEARTRNRPTDRLVLQPPDQIRNLDSKHKNTGLKDQTDSGPFLPPKYLLPEDRNPRDIAPEKVPSEETLPNGSEIVPSEESTTSDDSSREIFPTRDHDVDEELLLKSLTLQNADVGVGRVMDTELPLVLHSLPPVKTAEEFVEEPEVLFQRLVDIEVMLKPQEKDEDNLNSALLKHVALCVEMKNIQSKMNVINRHGQYYMKKARSGLREILEERLKALNNQWDKLQDHASARQKDLEQLVQDKADGDLSGEDSSLNALRNNTALLSSLYFNTENEDIKRLLNKLGLFSDEEDSESRQHFDDDFLDYQSAFHDLFEWLTTTEEEIQGVSTLESEVTEMRQRLKRLQDLCRQVQQKKPQLDDLLKRSEKFVELPSENGKEHGTELRHLWRDVMLKACIKIQELQKVLRVIIMKGIDVGNKDGFTKTLSECEIGVTQLLQGLQECCAVDTRDDCAVPIALHQVFSSEADLLSTILDDLKSSSQNTENSLILNELSNQLTNVHTQLETWRQQLHVAAATEIIEPVEKETMLEEVSEEPRSPRSPRPKTWPEHSNLATQVMVELKKFEDWLNNAEESLQTFIGIAIPQTLNEMKSKLKEVQLVARNIHNKIAEMEYSLNSLAGSKDESDYTELSEKCHYCLTRAKELKSRSDIQTNEFKDIRFHWELFESRFAEMLQWLQKTRTNLILPLKERDEDSVEFVLGKLLKVRELEKKLSEKVTVKDDVLRQGEHVHAKTEASNVNVKIEQLREDWLRIEVDLSKERVRLEKVMKLWKEYDRKQEEMYEWLTGILASLHALEHRDKTIDVVKSQLALIQQHHDEIDNHLTLKESVDVSFHFLVDNIQGNIERLQVKQQQLNSHWQELQSLVSDRFDELVAVEWELEKASMTSCVQELNVCLGAAKELVLVKVPPIGSSSLEEIKSLVAQYQKAKRELRSKQESLEELGRKSRSENMEVENCSTSLQSIAQLDEEWKRVNSSLIDKEESLKISLNNWIEFQRQLTHLVDTDSWFATREAAMSKYQHICTEKDRNIALEDVKAMKGFLATQKISVTAFVESARGLLTEGLYDQEEIEGILGDIEERWVDINTKVNECEEWLSEMTTKHKSCRDSIGSIMTFLDEAELILQSLSSFDGDLGSLTSQKTKLCNLETELNDLRSTVYNLNSILVELNNVCDESIIHELEKDIQELNQRYGGVGEQIASKKAQAEELLSACQDFDKDCAELFAWFECQSEVLDRDEEEGPPLLASDLAQLKEYQQLQEDFNRQQEFLETVRNRGQDLKSKIKQGNLYISPKLTRLARKCSDFAVALNQKQENLKIKTCSWLEFCDKLQALDERVKESEKMAYTTRYSDTMKHYRLLQTLIRETIQMRPELDELTEFTEQNFLDKNSEQGKNARNEVEELRQRLEILSSELDNKKTEIETVQKLQAKFQEQCRHLNAVLQDTEAKLVTGDEMDHMHEQEQSFEFFQSNRERYQEELLCAQRLAETLDQNTNVDTATGAQIEERFNELNQRWDSTCRAVEKHRENMQNRLGKWRDFKQKHKAFVSWLTEFESRPGLQPVASSDITDLESQVEFVEACRKELDARQNEFDILHATTAHCLTRSNDTVTEAVEKEYREAEQRWLRVSDCVASNQRTLELTLGDWQEYTTVMEDTMHWLRQTELYLKTCSAASLSDVEKYYERLKELSNEVEERRPHLELLTQRGRRLSRMSSYANADHINNQVSVMGALWTNVCTCLSTKMHCTIDCLHYLRRFMDNFESLSAWLHRLEDILRCDRKHFYSCSPEEQRAKIKAFRKEIESHEAQRTSINDATLQLIDKELGNELLRHIMEQRDTLNERWEALCIQLGISYKKAEQTKYSLKLLEAQLTQLNKWMACVERQITEFSMALSCDIDELSQQIVDLQISQREINARSPDVISVLSLCVRLQSCAFPGESDLRDLQIARDSFESRWKKISKNVGQLLKQDQDRIALCKEFRGDYKQFMTWLRTFENQVTVPSGRCEDLHELSLEISRLQDLKRQVGAKGVLVERLLTRGNCLVDGSFSNSAKLIRQMIGKVQERWYGVTQELDDSIRKFHMLSKDFVEFEEERRNVNAWLTDIEVRLISLEQVENEQQTEEQRLQDLKTLQHHINMKYGSLSDLTSQVTKLKGCCSISDYRLQQQKVEELKLRYEQALHYSLTLMLDLAVPSPFSSPDRVAARLPFSEVTP